MRVERAPGRAVDHRAADRARLARYGVTRATTRSPCSRRSREGMQVGDVYEGPAALRSARLRPAARVRAPEALGELFVETDGRTSVPLAEVVTLDEADGPAVVKRARTASASSAST